jgi:hypothetical protein
MYAGASSVMASLWRVDDDATTELMRHFYRGVLRDGLRPAAALRQAQLSMWAQRRWRSPYFWAGFVLQGDYDRAIRGGGAGAGRAWTKTFVAWTTVLVVILCACAAAVLALRRGRARLGR